MDNESVIYTMGFYSVGKNKITKLSEKKKWMHLRNIILREVTEVQKDEYCMLSHI